MADIDQTVRMFEAEIASLDRQIEAGKMGANPLDKANLANNRAYRKRLKHSLREIVNLHLAREAAKAEVSL